MKLWLYVFDNKVPPVLSALANPQQLLPLYRSIEDLFPVPLKKERLVAHNPKEVYLLFRQVCQDIRSCLELTHVSTRR